MRLVLTTLLTLTSLYGIGENTVTMKANFTQTITNDKNNTITYSGDMLAKRPNLTMWHYAKPVEKTVYITTSNVTIIEPELEQVIIKQLENSIDILAILAAATKVTENQYNAYYHDKEYKINLENSEIKTISYHDAFDNLVVITFTTRKVNAPIEDALFYPSIPRDFDIIRD